MEVFSARDLPEAPLAGVVEVGEAFCPQMGFFYFFIFLDVGKFGEIRENPAPKGLGR